MKAVVWHDVGKISVDEVPDPAAEEAAGLLGQFAGEQDRAAPRIAPANGQWEPGDAPSLALRWATEAVVKAGTIGIVGVYPPQHEGTADPASVWTRQETMPDVLPVTLEIGLSRRRP